MPERARDILGFSAAVLLGIAGFFVFAGWWVLIPTNIAWLAQGDPLTHQIDRAMHTLGWLFYRDTAWQIPPGGNPRLGIELANSIALVDGLPLFAIPLKLVSAWLPHPFQYWGYWWLLCFTLQSLLSYLLARELDASRPVALLAAAFALITPAFLFRLPLHMALAGHWTILAGLYLYARRPPPAAWSWPMLIVLTASIHAYLFAMVCALWVASYVQRIWLGSLRGPSIAVEPLVIAISGALVLWLVGFFYTGTLGAIGFGFFRLNLLAPVLTYGSWSKLIPSLAHSDYDYEGLSFFGIGIFGALVLAVLTGSIGALRDLASRRWAPLALLCLAFCVFALSNVIGLGDREMAPIPLGPLEPIGATFRASGRFVWPALYLLTIGAVVLAARRLPVLAAVPLLLVLFAAQLYDSSAGWSAFRGQITTPAETWPTPLTSPVWERAPAAGYSRLRALPPVFNNPDYRWLEYVAYTHGMDVDAIHLGRVDTAALASLAERDATEIATGSLEPKTLYIVDQRIARQIKAIVQPSDLFASIDGRLLYARDGAELVADLGIDPHGAATVESWLPEPLMFTTSP